jgi:hypothetical protein
MGRRVSGQKGLAHRLERPFPGPGALRLSQTRQMAPQGQTKRSQVFSKGTRRPYLVTGLGGGGQSVNIRGDDEQVSFDTYYPISKMLASLAVRGVFPSVRTSPSL